MLLLQSYGHAVRPFVLPRTLLPTVSLAGLRPDSIVFLVDVIFEGVQILSVAHRCTLNEAGEVVDCEGRTIEEVLGSVDLVISDPEAIDAAESLSLCASSCSFEQPLHAQMLLSFYVPTPTPTPPIVLLHEPQSFFVNHEVCDEMEPAVPNNIFSNVTFRTDVSQCWRTEPTFPGVGELCPSDAKLAYDIRRGHEIRYGCGKLDVDPEVTLYISRRGQDLREVEWGTLISCDSPNVCSARVEFSFADGETGLSDGLSFGDRVFPGLLALTSGTQA
jgi:hypothetical protein